MNEDEEIEEVRELLYNILKDYPAGVTSTFLEEQYKKKFVELGIASPLPKDWLHYVKLADEFEVKHQASFTMVYIVNVDSKWQMPEELSLEDAEGQIPASPLSMAVQPLTPFLNSQSSSDTSCASCFALSSKLQPMAIYSLPKVGAPVEVNVVSAMDPDNIFVRLCLWDPVPDYLYSALSRMSNEQSEQSEAEIVPGELYAAQVNNSWERVQTVRKTATNMTHDHWVVFAVDMGFFHILHAGELRPLSVEVKAFKKIFLVKCKLHGVKPVNGQFSENGVINEHLSCAVKWSREAQQVVTQLFFQTKNTQFVPHKEWSYENSCVSNNIPTSTGKFIVDGEDVGARLVHMDIACNI